MQQMKLPEVEAANLAMTQSGLERGLVMRAELGADGLVRGTASTYGNADRMDRVLLPGAFGKAAITVPLLLNHDDVPLGQSVFTPTAAGLAHASEMVGDPVQPGTGVPIRALLHKGYPATSIGWLPKTQYFGWAQFARAEPDRAKVCAAQGVVQSENLRYFGDVELVENSLVPIPANPRALLEAASLLAPRSAERAQLETMAELAAGARHSSNDQAAIQRAHDATVEAGAMCQDAADTTPLEPGAPEPGNEADDTGISGGWYDHMRSAQRHIEAAAAVVEQAADKPRFAMPDGSYPINTCSDVASAAKLAYHSKTYSFEEVRAHVMKAKNALDCPDSVLPGTWSDDGQQSAPDLSALDGIEDLDRELAAMKAR